jgi:hypothetical protein
MEITVDVPEDVAEGLAAKWGDLPRAALESLAAEGFRSGALSEAQVRRMLGFSVRLEVDAFLKSRGIYLDYTVDDVERDTAASRQAR